MYLYILYYDNNSRLALTIFLDDVLRRKVKLFGRDTLAKVVVKQEEQLKILQEAHNSNISAHSAETKTYNKIREYFYWPNLQDDVRKWVFPLVFIPSFFPYVFLFYVHWQTNATHLHAPRFLSAKLVKDRAASKVCQKSYNQ